MGLFWVINIVLILGVVVVLVQPLSLSILFQKRKIIALVSGVLFTAVVIYIFVGNPTRYDEPLKARLEQNIENMPFEAVITKLEIRLRKNPDDIKGWRILAKAYETQNLVMKAQRAWQRVLYIEESDYDALMNLANLIINSNQMEVTDSAAILLNRVLEYYPKDPQARYLLALQLIQREKIPQGLSVWKILFNEAENNSSWKIFLQQKINTYK